MALLWQQCNTLMQRWQDACNNYNHWQNVSGFWSPRSIDYFLSTLFLWWQSIAKYLQFLDSWEIWLHLKNKYPHQVQQPHHSNLNIRHPKLNILRMFDVRGEKHLHPNNGIATSSVSKETSGCSSGGAKSLDVDTGLSGRVTFGKCMHFAQTKIIFWRCHW